MYARTRPRKVLPTTQTIRKVTAVKPSKQQGVVNYDYEVSKGFRNYLSYPVVLTDRNNMSVKIPSKRQRYNEDNECELHIDVTIRYGADVVLDYTHILDNLDDNSPPELKIIKEALNNNRVTVSYGQRYIQFSYRVDDFLLKRNNYSVYLEQVDTVISRGDISFDVVHPYSAIGQALILNREPDMFHYRLLINDPFNQFGDRYVNINGDVYPVRKTVDHSVAPGVYRYTDTTKRYEFKDADKALNLFTTEVLASQLGVPEEHVRAQIEQQTMKYKNQQLELERQLNELKHDHAKSEAKRKKKLDKQTSALKRRESEVKQMELEYKRLSSIEAQRLQQLKHELETKSANRKDTSELVKWLPAFIGGCAALFALVF